MQPLLKLATPLCAAFFLWACAGENFGGSRNKVLAWAAPEGFVSLPEITSPSFDLLVLGRQLPPPEGSEILVYLEGDGAPWPSTYHPPGDPTPLRPLALALAARQPGGSAIYLGRPCQYLGADALAACPIAYWTHRRYAPEVVAAYDAVLDQLTARYPGHSLRLVGYSGGGVIALALLARRQDIRQVITIASPVDPAAWTRLQGLSSLALPPPAENPGHLERAIHLAGARDTIVPPTIPREYVRRYGGELRIQPDFDHECCWVRDWAQLFPPPPTP